jgi:hypothetical protein
VASDTATAQKSFGSPEVVQVQTLLEMAAIGDQSDPAGVLVIINLTLNVNPRGSPLSSSKI